MNEKLQWVLIAAFFAVTGYFVWTTGAMLWIILWIVGLVIVGLGVTGALGSIYAKITGRP